MFEMAGLSVDDDLLYYPRSDQYQDYFTFYEHSSDYLFFNPILKEMGPEGFVAVCEAHPISGWCCLLTGRNSAYPLAPSLADFVDLLIRAIQLQKRNKAEIYEYITQADHVFDLEQAKNQSWELIRRVSETRDIADRLRCLDLTLRFLDRDDFLHGDMNILYPFTRELRICLRGAGLRFWTQYEQSFQNAKKDFLKCIKISPQFLSYDNSNEQIVWRKPAEGKEMRIKLEDAFLGYLTETDPIVSV